MSLDTDPFDDGFGDDDPEDAFDASDPLKQRIANLALRLSWIYHRLPYTLRDDVREHLVRLHDDLIAIREELED